MTSGLVVTTCNSTGRLAARTAKRMHTRGTRLGDRRASHLRIARPGRLVTGTAFCQGVAPPACIVVTRSDHPERHTAPRRAACVVRPAGGRTTPRVDRPAAAIVLVGPIVVRGGHRFPRAGLACTCGD